MWNIHTMPYVNECWLQPGSKVGLVLALRTTQLSHVYFEKSLEFFLSDLSESIFKAWFSYVGKIPDDWGFYFCRPSQIYQIKPGFLMSAKSQTIRHFTRCRPSKINRILATIVSDSLPMNLAGNGKCAKNWNLRHRGTGAQQFRGFIERNSSLTSPTVQILVFICWEWLPTIAETWDASGKLERSRFSRFVPVHSRRTEISTIWSFH